MPIDHYIIAPSGYKEDGLKFRRHRLAERLLQDSQTQTVYWIFPKNNSSISRLIKSRTKQKYKSNKFVEIGLKDFKNLIGNQGYLSKSLCKRIVSYNENNNKKILWFTFPIYSGLTQYNIWDRIVYDCSDNWGISVTSSKGLRKILAIISSQLINNSEKKIINNSDFLFSTSKFLDDKIKSISKRKSIVVENGVDFKMFNSSKNNQLEHIVGPKIGFVGGVKKKIDFQLLINLSKKFPHYNIVLVGPNATKNFLKLNELLEMPNVHSFGQVDYEDVPNYIKSLDVGLLPYKKIDYNKAVSPLKLFEYLATGIPVVGYGLPTTKKYAKNGVYMYAHNQEEFITLCDYMVSIRNRKSYVRSRINLARENNWEKKLSYIINVVLKSL